MLTWTHSTSTYDLSYDKIRLFRCRAVAKEGRESTDRPKRDHHYYRHIWTLVLFNWKVNIRYLDAIYKFWYLIFSEFMWSGKIFWIFLRINLLQVNIEKKSLIYVQKRFFSCKKVFLSVLSWNSLIYYIRNLNKSNSNEGIKDIEVVQECPEEPTIKNQGINKNI